MTKTAVTTATATRPLTIDKAHSEVTFQVRHLLTRVRGRFGDFAGTIVFNPERPADSSASFTIQTASVDTNQPDRDQHLRSEDFFHTQQFPTITFTSTRVVETAPDRFDVIGALSIRGVTREVTIPVTYLGTATDPWGHEKAGFEAELTLNRKDYGLSWNAALETGGFLVGDDVKIALAIQAAATQA